MSLQRPTSTIPCLQVHPGSSSLVHCQPMRRPVPRTAFASCGQKPKLFYSSTVRRRPIFRRCWLRKSMAVFHYSHHPIRLSARSSRSWLQTSRFWSSRLRLVRCPCPTGGHEEGDELGLTPNNLARSDDAENGAIDRTISRRIPHGLSEREEEILKGVVRGHSNKMIARTCGVTDATIKVHMKSILRKIRVANRTQAAIWALEQGYGADANRRSPALRPLPGVAAA